MTRATSRVKLPVPRWSRTRTPGPELARRRRSALLRFGVFFIVTGMLTAFLTAQITRVAGGGGYRLSAVFDDASGLRAGDDVKIAGAPVGEVDAVSVVKGRALVSLTVHDHVRIPADSEAAIRWRDAIGRRVIYLIPGTGTDLMRPGTRITHTRSVVDIGQLLDALAPLTRSLDPDRLNQILTSLDQAMNGNADDIGRLIVSIDDLTSTIAARRRSIARTVDDYATVTTVVARRDKQISQAIDNLASLSDGFAGNTGLIDDSLVQLSRMARTADDVLGKNSAELSSLLGELSVLTGGVRRNNATLTRLLDVAGPKLQQVFAAVDNGRFIIGAAPCVSLAAPPCPYPARLPASMEGAGRLDSPAALRRQLIGGE